MKNQSNIYGNILLYGKVVHACLTIHSPFTYTRFSLYEFQIDEIVNISAPIRERYHEVPVGYKRCLKLSMTDGVQRVFGMEYRPIKELEVLASSGLKVCY